ncbi:hypothetical protein, partial [Methylacidiphilum caldifontis]|uniref:hypothetical protein n=1 Tax=Methylacidiphilum caldifontis TaxID=2795386 RepID=UPI001ABC4268
NHKEDRIVFSVQGSLAKSIHVEESNKTYFGMNNTTNSLGIFAFLCKFRTFLALILAIMRMN